MKLGDLLLNQNIIVQLVWGEQNIEFTSAVVERENELVYVTAYIHNGSELQLNITDGAGVICNVFADNSVTGQRISWRNVELTTVNRSGRCRYCIKTHGYNKVANPDDRRDNERTVIRVEGLAKDEDSEEAIKVVVNDISGVGVAFHAPVSYSPESQKVIISFTDYIDDKQFNVKVEGMISRMSNEKNHTVVGCRLVGENRDYQVYRFIKHLKGKNRNKTNAITEEEQEK